MRRKIQTIYKNNKVNGVGRNEVVKLTEDELEAMTSELNAQSRRFGKSRIQKRAEHVKLWNEIVQK